MFDLICIGMALVDSIIRGFDPSPVSPSGYRAVSGSLNAGGEAVNEAVAAAKLGLKTAILCNLGEDMAGELVLRTLKDSGVDTDFVFRDAATPVTTMFVNEDGTRKSVTNAAHRYHFHPEKRPELFTEAKALILGSLFRAPFDDPEIILSVLREAKKKGCLVIADTKLPNFADLKLEDLKESLPLIDWITPNEEEAKYFTGREDPEEMADVLLASGIRNVIIKLGGKGCFMKNGDGTLLLPPYPVCAVDTTGAGDNFAAGFVSEILRGADPKKALRFANACGAICTTEVGAGTALKNREQVVEWMGKNAESFPEL